MLAISPHNDGGILLFSVSSQSGWVLSALRQTCRKREINIDLSNFSEFEYFFISLICFSDSFAFFKSLSLGSHVCSVVPGGINESSFALRTRADSKTSLYTSKKFLSCWPSICAAIPLQVNESSKHACQMSKACPKWCLSSLSPFWKAYTYVTYTSRTHNYVQLYMPQAFFFISNFDIQIFYTDVLN